MRKETPPKLKMETKYRGKTVVKDGNLNVVILIPVSPERSGKETPAHVSAEGTASESERVLELCLVKPLVEPLAKIVFNVNRDVATPAQATAFNYVFPIRYDFRYFAEVGLLSVETGIHPALVTISSIIKEVQESIPSVKFEKPEPIRVLGAEGIVNVEITPSVEALNYVTHPRLVFRQPYGVRHGEVASEVMVRTSRSLSSVGSTGVTPKEILVTQQDFLKYFLGASLPRVIMDRPLLILAVKPQDRVYEYVEFLKRILRELYRIHVGGLPTPIDLRTDFEEVKLDVRAGKHIYVMDLDEAFHKEIKGSMIQYIIDRLRELYSQGFGFLVFYGSEKVLGSIMSLWYRDTSNGKLLGKILQPLHVRIQEDPRIFNLANLMWGKVIDFNDIGRSIDSGYVDLSSYATMLEDEFYRRITKLVSDINTIIKIEPSKKNEGNLSGETLLHYGIKAFVVNYLIKHENIPDSDVFTEYDAGGVILDVFARHPKYGDLAVEVETLYGTALPLLKLRRTIDSRLSKGFKLWVVIPNPQFMLFLGDLAKLREFYMRRYPDTVEFFTLDTYSQRLISFPKITEKVKQLIESQGQE